MKKLVTIEVEDEGCIPSHLKIISVEDVPIKPGTMCVFWEKDSLCQFWVDELAEIDDDVYFTLDGSCWTNCKPLPAHMVKFFEDLLK